jgi:hypothetical protein
MAQTWAHFKTAQQQACPTLHAQLKAGGVLQPEGPVRQVQLRVMRNGNDGQQIEHACAVRKEPVPGCMMTHEAVARGGSMPAVCKVHKCKGHTREWAASIHTVAGTRRRHVDH